MLLLFSEEDLLSDQERLVIEAAIRLNGHKNVREWVDSDPSLSYSVVTKTLSGVRPPRKLAGALTSVVREAGLEDRLPGGGKARLPA